MHVLWVSDSPDTPSGFGNVTAHVCGALARLGHRISILGWQTREVGDWNGCRIFPTLQDRFGGDALFPLLVRARPDIVIALADIWWLPQFCAPHVRRQMELTNTPWCLYFPVDGDIGDDRLPASWIEMLREVDIRVAMSRYGQRIARNCGIECECIPHGVDLNLFRPPEDREAIKAGLGYEGKFVILSDSRNQPRKMLPRLLDSFARFAADRPNVVLHLHTDCDDEFTRSLVYSYDVRRDVEHLGLQSQVRFSRGFAMKKGGGLPAAQLAAYYRAADIHLLGSSGEGFGLPTLQAAAAGAVPMASAYSASLELTAGHGEPLPVADWAENEFGIRRALIDVDATAGILARYHASRDLLRTRSRQARQFAESYGWDRIVGQWDELLRSIASSRHRLRTPVTVRTESIEKIAPRLAPKGSGISVSLKVVDREFGRLEAAILADARGSFSDIRIPAVPPPCAVADVCVPRRPGYIGMAAGDAAIFRKLRCIFPILNGWTPCADRAQGDDPEDIEIRLLDRPEDARYDLAQSMLLLDHEGALPEPILIDAALYRVPCIGAAGRLQTFLWPELVVATANDAVTAARGLLTDAARLRRLATLARTRCLQGYRPSEEDAARSLRRLHRAAHARHAEMEARA
jgi:glycosyltransferase involved in cell wall biosynthesis